ncbi:MAG: TVP38/TMEM64 family protein [Hyphomicrobiales bacterium]|nr:TVP38/TMEM64 family protein [Hyphomicrobiales bacterium]MCP5373371.1 TVP38/TMEM64 family protein [Hyphomicrobiales bacterium]
MNRDWIDANVRGQGFAGEALFVLAGAAFTALGLPRQIVSFLAGYAFGFAEGTAWALLATTLGCVTTFQVARLAGRGAVAARFPDRLRRADDFLRRNPFAATLLIRLLPVGSNFATNLAGGVSSIPLLPFVAGSALGFIPQTAVFALVGSGVEVDPVLRIGVGAVLFVASAALGVQLYRSHRRRRRAEGAAP